MKLFPSFKKREEKTNLDYSLEFKGYINRSIDDQNGRQGFILPIAKKIYLKIKQVLRINRNYEIVEPPDSLLTIYKAFKVEGYLRRARDRYVELIWKNGYKFTGRNKKAKDYIEKRFDQISMVTDKPTEEFFDQIAESLVLYYNAFIVKIRNVSASGGRERRTFYGKQLFPVAAYFIVEPHRMLAKRERDNGKIKYWELFDERKKVIRRFNIEDVIHITMNKSQNEIFGTPAAVNVLDDIRALRRMEENVEILVFQHAIPLYQYKVGTAEEGPQDGEVEAVQHRIDNMVVHGMLVTDGRHDIEAVGVRGQALDIDKYMEYFRERIMIGLGHSASSMGLGQVSRSSMGTVSKQVLDASARFQRRIKSYVEQFMIRELLAEGHFDIFDQKNKVMFFIPEIDLDDRIRREYHTSSMWQANLLDHDEARAEIGRDPMSQSDFDKTFFKLITLPTTLAKLQLQAMGSEEETSTGTTAAQSQKEIPKNQYGPKRRSGPAKRGTDAVFSPELEEAISEYVEIIRTQLDCAHEDILTSMNDSDDPFSTNISVSRGISIEKTSKVLIKTFQDAVMNTAGAGIFSDHYQILGTIHERNGRIISDFFADVSSLIKEYPKEMAADIVFDGVQFKMMLMASWIVQKTYWLGCSFAAKERGCEIMRIIKDDIELDEIDLNAVSFDSVYPLGYDDVYRTGNLVV